MASLINRSISLVSNGLSSLKTTESNSIMNIDFNSTSSEDNPLRVFVSAKKDINEIFIKVEKFVKNVHEFYRSYDDELITQEDKILQVESAVDKIAGIRDVLTRNHMKVGNSRNKRMFPNQQRMTLPRWLFLGAPVTEKARLSIQFCKTRSSQQELVTRPIASFRLKAPTNLSPT